MIPFAICSGIIEWTDEMEPLEIRLLELAPDFCTFRLPLRFQSRADKVSKIYFRFYSRESKQRNLIIPASFKLAERETERYWTVWEYRTDDAAFCGAAALLTEEYLGYIRAKLSMTDEELSHYMTGIYPEDREQDFASCGEEQMQQFMKTVAEGYREETWLWVRSAVKDGEVTLPGIGLALEDHGMIGRFLSEPFHQFCESYRERTGLLMRDGSGVHRHPLADLPVTMICVGNASCPVQSPSLSECRAVIRRAAEEQLQVVFTLPPVSETVLTDVQEKLTELHAWLEQTDYSLIIQANDAGIIDWMGMKSFSRYQVKTGFMTDKRIRDSRIMYMDRNTDDQNATDRNADDRNATDRNADDQNAADRNPRNHNAAAYPEWLPGEYGEYLYIPFYRMNTGTFCPLYAAVQNGDRGKSCRVTECPGYCSRYVFLYPRHLQMIGRYNSVFGTDTETLCRGERLREACFRGVRYVILNANVRFT